MNIDEFRSKIKSGKQIFVNNKAYKVRQVIKFRFDDNNYYIKCFLSNGFVLADDGESNSYLLVKEVKTNINKPFPKELVFKNKKFKFLFTAHAIAEEIEGKEIFKEGEGEKFWDYKSRKNSYLSIGIIDSTQKRLDFYGKIVDINNVKIE